MFRPHPARGIEVLSELYFFLLFEYNNSFQTRHQYRAASHFSHNTVSVDLTEMTVCTNIFAAVKNDGNILCTYSTETGFAEWVVLEISQDGAFTDSFENLSVNRLILKQDQSIPVGTGTIYPASFLTGQYL
jgi:hypothetical protein